jgi:hypothetical protein
MNPVRPGPHDLQGLPTLTEVIELPARAALPASAPSGAAIVPEPDRAAVAAVTAAGVVSEEQLVERVLTDLQRNADLMLEVRLREALAPIVARLSDGLVHDVQLEFGATLRDIVERAVTQELARQRGR